MALLTASCSRHRTNASSTRTSPPPPPPQRHSIRSNRSPRLGPPRPDDDRGPVVRDARRGLDELSGAHWEFLEAGDARLDTIRIRYG